MRDCFWKFLCVLFAFVGLVVTSSSLLAATVTVEMLNLSFVPSDITINPGDTVVWTNADPIGHDTTSGTGGSPTHIWGSQLFEQGESFSFTFTNGPAVYPYYCTPHAFIGMIGNITVSDGSAPPLISVVRPGNGAVFPTGSNVVFEVAASSSGSPLARVDFFVNSAFAGSTSNSPFQITLTNFPPGSYDLSGVGYDNQGRPSAPAHAGITIQGASSGVTVNIVTPVEGETFFLGDAIQVQASASDPLGIVKQMELFVNGVSSGLSQSPYEWTITPPTGHFALVAVASDAATNRFSSPTVNISVIPATDLPVILIPPRNIAAPPGGSAIFSVTASGTAPLFYQWRFFGTNLSAANSNLLNLQNIGTEDAGPYDVVVTNPLGSVTSSVAILTVSNIPPSITITEPADGSKFPVGLNINVSARTVHNEGTVTSVDFLLGGSAVATVTNSPYSTTLTNLGAGNYQLVARAHDNTGPSFESLPTFFYVVAPPAVSLSQPHDGDVFSIVSNITIQADVSATIAGITNVEFFSDGIPLGQAVSFPYVTITNLNQPGMHSLTAAAFDGVGQAGTSAPVVVRAFLPESIAPTITITSCPPKFAKLAAPDVTIAGKAADNIGIDHVEFRVNNGAFQRALGTNQWEANVVLSPGFNTIFFRSVDLAGNSSSPDIRFLKCIISEPLTVRIVGSGRVTPDLNGRSLQLGKTYQVTAVPDSGQVFAGWSGSVNTTTQRLAFQMQSNFVLTANFAPDPFPAVLGRYVGLIMDSNALSSVSAGFLDFQLSKRGVFTGQILMESNKRAFHGQLGSDGRASMPVIKGGRVPLVLSLHLGLDSETDPLCGTLTDGVWTSLLFAQRAPFFQRTNPAPQFGKRAFVLYQPGVNVSQQIAIGTATITAGGNAMITGTMNDARKFSSQTALTADGSAPIFLAPGKGELIIGWLNFPAESETLVQGDVVWTRASSDSATTKLLAAPAALTVFPFAPTLDNGAVSLPDAVIGEPYSVSLSASPTGRGPYDLSISNHPPDGMMLAIVSNHTSSAYVLLLATNNLIAGQRQRFSVSATDAEGSNASRVYDVRVVNPPPQIPSTRVELKTGVPVEFALQATNGQGTLWWTFVDGPLPDGIQIDTNGIVFGTPTPDASEFNEDGLYTNVIQVTDSFTDRLTGETKPRSALQTITQRVRLSYQFNIQPVRTDGPSLVNCILCHGPGFRPDFSSEFASSLLNVSAGSGPCPKNAFYVLAGDPDDSLVVQKITLPSCGFRMPFGGPYLNNTQINRFIRWVTELTSEDSD